MYLVLEPVTLMTWIRQGMSIITACVQHCKGSFIHCKSQENLYEAREKSILVYREYCLCRKSGRIYRQLELPRYFHQVVELKI